MSTTLEKIEAEQIEVMENSASSRISDGEKVVVDSGDYIPNEARDEDVVTLKTWAVIVVSILIKPACFCLIESDPLRFLRSQLLGRDYSRCDPNSGCHPARKPWQRRMVDDSVGKPQRIPALLADLVQDIQCALQSPS